MGGRDMVHGKWNIIVSFGQTQIRGGKFQELEQMHLMNISLNPYFQKPRHQSIMHWHPKIYGKIGWEIHGMQQMEYHHEFLLQEQI